MLKLLRLLCAAGVVAVCSANAIEGWTYDRGTSANCDGSVGGTGVCGPEHWGNLHGAESCGDNSGQSPINLAQAVNTNQIPVMHFDYESGCSNWTQGANDHNFNIEFAPHCYNLTFTYEEEKFYLSSLHFHSPSEHTIGGGSFAAEAHLLHYSFTTDSIIYVSILLTESADMLPFTNNSFLDSLWNYRSVADITGDSATQHDMIINPYEDLFPGAYSHFNYIGSLTTPPCTPGAFWFVFDTPVPISSDDVNIIRSGIASVPDSKKSQQGNTNRPVQRKNDRTLYYSLGISSKSDVVYDQDSCECEDSKMALFISIAACAISLLCAISLCLMYRSVLGVKHSVKDQNERSGTTTLSSPVDESKNTNPLHNEHVASGGSSVL